MKSIMSRNPYTGQVKQQIAYFSNELLEKCFEKTSVALRLQAKRQPKEKMSMIRQLIPQIQKNQTEISKLITFQTGKPIVQAELQIKQALKICEYYSKHAEAILSSNVKSDAKKKTLIKYMPLGTIFCILPFTNPLMLTLHHALPQLLLGNCVMVKNSSITPGVSKLVERLMMKSGFQSGEYQSMFLQQDKTELILSRGEIAGVSFTGSTQSGRHIGAIAGKNLKISSLQLSSNDGMIVMEDADLDLAVESIFNKGMYNSGQAGACPKRIIIKQSKYEQFKTRLVEKAKKLIIGNPLDRETSIGPLSTPDLLQKLQSQMKRILPKFKIIYQTPKIEKPFFPVTILQGDNEIFDEEILGPVVFLQKAKDNKEIVEMANSTRYGNNHFVFSLKKGEEIIQGLKGGAVYVNRLDTGGCYVGKGGIKQSGYGRAGGYQGVRQFANIKTVYIS